MDRSIEFAADVMTILRKLAVVFTPEEKFIRVKCGRKNCFETRESKSLFIRD